MDWTGLTMHTPRLQQLVPSSTASCFLAVEPLRHRLLDSERSKVTCIFNKLQQRWLRLTPYVFFEIVLSVHDLYLLFLMDATCIWWR